MGGHTYILVHTRLLLEEGLIPPMFSFWFARGRGADLLESLTQSSSRQNASDINDLPELPVLEGAGPSAGCDLVSIATVTMTSSQRAVEAGSSLSLRMT